MRSVEVLQNKSIGTKKRLRPRIQRPPITVLKTVDCNRSISSNPIASAIFCTDKALIIQGFVVSGIPEFWSSGEGSFPHLLDHFRSPSETGANEGTVEAFVIQR